MPRHSPRVAARIFSGEAVVITPIENMIRMFNPVGSRIWELIDGTRTVSDIAATLVAEYQVDPDKAIVEVEGFLNELSERGLIEYVD